MYLEYILYIACILALVLSVWAQIKVSSTFGKYSRVSTRAGYTGAELARRMLDANGLYHVRIECIGGNLSDHYDPRSEVLRLSEAVYHGDSAASIGVAAHEAGHAVQHSVGYFPLKLRSALVPITGFASRFSWIAIMLGFLFMVFDAIIGYYVALFGIGLFAVTTLFGVVTLPCEFNASKRAIQTIRSMSVYSHEEISASRKVLFAAALTYVASTLVSLLQLLRLVVSLSNRKR